MTFHEKLIEKKVLISDGAWGTELVKKGFGTGECPELLNVDHPDIMKFITAKDDPDFWSKKWLRLADDV